MQEQTDINQIKQAQTTHELHPLLSSRWSPRAFSEQVIAPELVATLFEAARWSASGANGQPWSFIIASRQESDEFDRLVACMNSSNAEWAKDAGLVGIAVAQTIRADGKASRLALYDLGLAMQNLCIQATALNLYVHQMGGFSMEKARSTYNIPEIHEPGVAFAVGYLGDPATLSEQNRQREWAVRTRKGLDEFVFSSEWGKTAGLGD